MKWLKKLKSKFFITSDDIGGFIIFIIIMAAFAGEPKKSWFRRQIDKIKSVLG